MKEVRLFIASAIIILKYMMIASTSRRFWSITLLSALFYFILFNSACNASFIFKSFGLAVNKNHRRERKEKKTDIAKWILEDDYGRMYEDVYAAIGKSRQVAVFRRENTTVVGFGVNGNGSCLEESIGCKPLHSLGQADEHGNYKHHVLLTGIAGDCRSAVRHLKQTALNHTFDFDADATGAFLANSLRKFLRNHPGERHLAVHAFIISAPAQSIDDRPGSSRMSLIHEVGATGNVNVVRGGTIGGPYSSKAKKRLEERYRGDLSEEESRVLISELFDPVLNGLGTDKDGTDGDEEGIVTPSQYEYIEIRDM